MNKYKYLFLIYTAALIVISFFAGIMYSGLAGLVLVVAASIVYGQRGGLLSATASSVAIFLLSYFARETISEIDIIIVILLYFLIGILIGRSIDMTRLQNEEVLKFKSAVDCIADSIYIVDPASMLVIDCNCSAYKTLGYTKEELLGMHAYDIKPNITKEELKRHYEKTLLDKKGNLETRHKCRNGNEIDVEVFLNVYSDRKKSLILESVRDVTAQKIYQREIQESERYLMTLLETTKDGFWIFNESGQIKDVNQAYCDMTGYTKTQLLNMQINDLEVIETPDETKEHILKILKNGSDLFQTRHRRSDKRIIDVEVSVSVLSKNSMELICFCRDITDRKIVEKDIIRFKKIIEHSDYGISISDKNGDLIYINKYYADIHCYEQYELEGKNLNIFHTKEQLPGFIAFYEQLIDKKNISMREVWHKNKWGKEFPMLMSGIVIGDEDNEFEYASVMAVDITNQKNMEQLLYLEYEQFKTTLLSIGDGVITADIDGNVKFMNIVAEKLTGFSFDEASGKALDDVIDIIDERTGEKCTNPGYIVLKTGEKQEISNSIKLTSKKGTSRFVEKSAAPIKDESGKTSGVVIILRDFTEKKKERDNIIYLSYHDHLTGLYNRRFFEQEMQRLDTSRNLPLTLVMMDVNGLKLTNDVFGHQSGDKVLKMVADIIKRECRSDEIIARIGGDEFVMLLPKTDSEQAEKVVSRIQKSISEEKINDIHLSISFGQGTKRMEDEEIDQVFKKAEDAMYRRKLSESSSMRYKSINVFMETLNDKKPDEEKHANNVSHICAKIGACMDMSFDKIEELKIAGFFHDIGKIVIDDHILNKGSNLDPKEKNEYRKHVEAGFKIMGAVNEYAPIAKHVIAHHERWDGSGYPNGLREEQISIEARIIAVADMFDKMIYINNFSVDQAFENIKNYSGNRLDPMIVDILIKHLHNDDEIKNIYDRI